MNISNRNEICWMKIVRSIPSFVRFGVVISDDSFHKERIREVPKPRVPYLLSMKMMLRFVIWNLKFFDLPREILEVRQMTHSHFEFIFWHVLTKLETNSPHVQKHHNLSFSNRWQHNKTSITTHFILKFQIDIRENAWENIKLVNKTNQLTMCLSQQSDDVNAF